MMTRNQLAARLRSLGLNEIEDGIFSLKGSNYCVSYALEDGYFMTIVHYDGKLDRHCYSFARSSIINGSILYAEC